MKKMAVLLLAAFLLFSFGCSDDDAAATYSVTYDANGADSGAVPVDPAAYSAGSDVTVLDNTNGLTKPGYSFAGWNSATDGSGTDLAAGATFEMPASNVTLYAKWTETYTVNFDKNDAAATGSMSDLTGVAGDTVQLTVNGFSNTGYSFDGWSTTPTGGVDYTNQQSFTMPAGDVTLYAQWVKNYTVTFDSQGADTSADPASISVKSNNVVESMPTEPVKAGYLFSGWYTAENGSGSEFTASTSVTADLTVYAWWKYDFSAVTYRDMVSVTGDTFTQEDVIGNSFEHTVSSFSIGKYEVTYKLWYTVYSWATNNGYTFANAGKEGNVGTAGAAPTPAKFEPVTYINWRDVMVWCNAYSQMAGLTPVYYSDSGKTTPLKDSSDGSYGSSVNTNAGSFDNPYVNWNANGYRLPTQGEWQYAASYQDGSNWTSSNYASGATADYNDATATGAVAWYDANSGSGTHDVGTKDPNQLGMYDMNGNVSEWCWDWCNTWPTDPQSDYRGPASGTSRVLRGGGWSSSVDYMRVGHRGFLNPYHENNPNGVGFRLSRTP